MFNMRHIDQQGSGNLHPDPSIILGSVPNNQQPNIHAVNHLPEHLGSAMYYGMPPYNTSPFYNSGAFPSSVSHGSFDHFRSSSNPGVMGGPTDEYGRNVYSDKRKNADGFPGYFNRFDASASSSSSVAPVNTNHPAIIEVGFHQSARNMSGAIGFETVMPHNPSQFIQGNYMGGFQRVGSVWRDQQPSSNGCDGIAPAWNQEPVITYIPNNVNGGFMENGNMCLPGYHEIFNSRGSTTYPPPPFHHQHNYQPPPPPLMQGGRGQNINFFPLHPTNSFPHNMMNPHDSVETMARRMGPMLQTGLRMFRTRHGGAEATQRDHNLPYLRVLPAEEVAILEMSEFHEVANHVDHHRDLRLDIEDMSYEELLGLGERIGNVSTGLTEETIRSNLKTRVYSSPATSINLEKEPTPVDEECEACIICQSDYENQENIGTLDCGHEYHAECLKTWLLVKNVCPICKASALSTMERKDIY